MMRNLGRLLGVLAFLPAGLPAQDEPARILGKTADNAATGDPLAWDFSGTDLTTKVRRDEVWVVDPYSDAAPFIRAFRLAALDGPARRVNLTLPAEAAGAPVLGIAEIPHGDFEGKNLVLVDPGFSGNGPPQPLLGIFEDSGVLVAGGSLTAPAGVDPNARLSSLDINPGKDEIAVYDITTHSAYLLDFNFGVSAGPIRLLGSQNFFVGPWRLGGRLEGAGMGIAYNGPDRLLAPGGFLNFLETHLLLEYDLATGAYSGRALDLSGAGLFGFQPDLAFVGIDTGTVAGQEAVLALNSGDDTIYAFALPVRPHGPPVASLGCGVAGAGFYRIDWVLDPVLPVDAVHIFENGVRVAILPPDASSFTSPLPLLGNAAMEVATEIGGKVSSVRATCQVQDAPRPPLPEVTADAIGFTILGGLAGVAVTRAPEAADRFRGYLLGLDSNAVAVFDHKLTILEVLALDPQVARVGANLAAMGVALLPFEGSEHLAVLDPDGPRNNDVPSAGIYALEGPERGKLRLGIDPVDLSRLNPTPFLLDWDAVDGARLVAGALLLDEFEPVVVEIEFDGARMTATRMVPVPQRALTPFGSEPLVGIGVSVLPSGNLLLAGSDTWSRTYTEALLTTPFSDDPLQSVRIVGYAQPLPNVDQFFAGLGQGIGPGFIIGFDTAFFPATEDDPDGVGVSYLPVGDVSLITNPSVNEVLGFPGLLLLHSENRASHPDLKARQLLQQAFDILPGTALAVPPQAAGLPGGVARTDFYYYVANRSSFSAASLSVKVELDGAEVAEAAERVAIGAGRYHRRALSGRSEREIRLTLVNEGAAGVQVEVILGAAGIGGGDAEPRFRRGDCDADGQVLINDPIVALSYLFLAGPEPGCPDACDADDEGALDITDVVLVLNYMFLAGARPAPPGPEACGPDPTAADALKPCVYDPALCAR